MDTCFTIQEKVRSFYRARTLRLVLVHAGRKKRKLKGGESDRASERRDTEPWEKRDEQPQEKEKERKIMNKRRMP